MRPMKTSPTQAPDSAEGSTPGPRLDSASVIASLSARFRVPLQRFFVKRRIPRDDVDDLVQDVFVRMASRPNVESLERLEAYLFTIAANLLRDRHRRQTFMGTDAHEPYDESLHGDAEHTLSPERSLLAAQIIAQLVEALFELPERTRAVFTLYHIEELPHLEISRRLGIAVSTIEKHMGRANAHLVKRMERL
jgi:RNA polymerase sigma factor (sigma-70 family)